MKSSLKIAIIGINRHFSKEHRILNEIKVFSAIYSVDGYGGTGVEGLTDFYPVKRPQRFIYRLVKILGGFSPQLRIWFEDWYYRDLAMHIMSEGYHFLIPHHIDDAIVALKAGIPYLFHSHEYLPRQFDGSRLFRFTEIRYRDLALKRILNEAVLNIVEGDMVARQYASVYGISKDSLIVMPSMPAFRPVFSKVSKLTSTINLIHHGTLVPERGIEMLMDIASALGSKYHLSLMGPGPEAYIQVLKDKAKQAGNINILPPVPYEKIVETLHGYDLGLIVFGSPHFHHKYMTVPNKFWECLQARVPVLVSPESAMASYVLESRCGVVAETATLHGYVAAIRKLCTEDIRLLKARCEEKAWVHSRDSWLEDYAVKVENAVVKAKHLKRRQERHKKHSRYYDYKTIKK